MRKAKTVMLNRLMRLLVGILFIACATSYAEERQESHFYFVQITDTHFGDNDHLDRTRNVVEQINTLPMEIECVVHTGDITMNRIEDRKIVDSGLSILGKLRVPIHYVPGNHDILLERPEATKTAYVKKFGGMISQTEYKNVQFIFVYTEPLRKSFTLKGYQPLLQLEEFLKKSNGKPVILFHHAPSVDDFYENKRYAGWGNDVREKWIRLINAYNVKAVIAGHFHRDEHHWLGHVPLYVSSSIAGFRGRQATFRIYEYRNGNIGYRTQYIK